MTMGKRYLKVTVTFERRDDGGLRAYSSDIPGFVLSHSNADAVIADVEPALRTMISSILNAKVNIAELSSLHDELAEVGIVGKSLRDQFVREYVAEPIAA